MLSCCFRPSFTLAEVLLTLGIIGVVSAITLPVLIQKHNHKVVETKLKKFYTSINQAILMAEVDYGDKCDWYKDVSTLGEVDEEGNIIEGTNEAQIWFNKYLAPYMVITKQELASDGAFFVYFSDGSALRPAPNGMRDWYFYPNPQNCIKQYGDKYNLEAFGKCVFAFAYIPNSNNQNWNYHYNKGMEPYKFAWSGDEKDLYKGCETNNPLYCTAIIQLNNWTIPDDYPRKIRN